MHSFAYLENFQGFSILEAIGVSRRVGVMTRDFRLYSRLARHLQGIREFETLILGEPLEGKSRYILLTSSKELPEVQEQYPDHFCYGIEDNSDSTFEQQIFIALNKGRKPFDCLMIGIDPGEVVGIVGIADGMTLFAEELFPPFQETLVGTVKQLLASFTTRQTIIRVGLSPTYQATNLLRLLLPFLGSNVHLELVDERKTSKGHVKTNSEAAIEIARRSGRPIGVTEATHKVNDYVIPEGRIHEIKKWSRRLSSNRTLPTSLAKKVAEGKITLEEALSAANKETGER